MVLSRIWDARSLVTVEKYRARRSPLFPLGGLEGRSSDTDTSVMTSKRCTGRSKLRMCRRTAHFQSLRFSALHRSLNISWATRGRKGGRGGGAMSSVFNVAIMTREVEIRVFRKLASLNSEQFIHDTKCPSIVFRANIFHHKKFAVHAHNKFYITRAIYPPPWRFKTACLSKTLKHSSTAKSF